MRSAPNGSMQMPFRVHHVQLAMPAGEEDTARAFYGEVLGLRQTAKPPVLAERGGVWFRGEGIELHLGVEDGFRPARKAHPGLLVDDVDALDRLARRIEDAGREVSYDDNFPGHRRFHTTDPFGNRLEFLTPHSVTSEGGHTPGGWLERLDEQERSDQGWDTAEGGRNVGPPVVAD